MLDITGIENALYVWASGVSGIDTIFSHQNSPRPVTPYVLINILQNIPVGIKEHQMTLLEDDSVDVDYSTVEELSVSINTYYAGAYQLATKLKDSLGRVTVNDQLYGDGIGYLRATTVQRIPEEIDSQWEERAQFDVFFSTRSIDEENIESIKKIEITNEINNYTTIIE